MASGEWCARFLAPRLAGLVSAHADLTIELAEMHLDPDLDRREADLFVRHGLPARGDLVRVSLGSMSAAIYGATSLVKKQPAAKTEARWRTCPWVAYDTPHEYFRTMAWLAERLGDRRPRVRASRFGLQLEAIRAGAGLGILPCFIGDADPDLVRLTPPVDDLAADFWLLVHRDLKDVARVRRVSDGIREAFRRDAPSLRGRRGLAARTRDQSPRL